MYDIIRRLIKPLDMQEKVVLAGKIQLEKRIFASRASFCLPKRGMLSGLMSLRIVSYERTLVARRTLGHYLKLLGPNFSYRF